MVEIFLAPPYGNIYPWGSLLHVGGEHPPSCRAEEKHHLHLKGADEEDLDSALE